MKIATTAFRDALALASRAAATYTTLDILKFALFSAADGRFTLACNDTTVYAEASGECDSGELQFCVRADRLSSALATAGESIELTLKGQALSWVSGRARYQMATRPAEDFPKPKRDTQQLLMTIEDPEIAGNLKRVVAGCAAKDIRDWAQGVLIECSKGVVTLVATDGAKLIALTTGATAEKDAQAIVHRESVGVLAEGALRARIYHDSAEFEYANGVIVVRLIAAKFPDWTRFTKSEKPSARITVGRLALAHAIKAALPFDEAGAIHFAVSGGALRIETADKTGDRAEVEVPVTDGGGDADVWFYSAAITPAIAAARGDDLVMAFGAFAGTPTASFEDGPLRCVCAAMRR